MENPVKLFIVEGEDRDFRFVNEMTDCFFSSGKFCSKVINLPASQNIYMLYKLLKDDDFDTDIVELLRDSVENARIVLEGYTRQDIDEVFLFFDYDVHQNNLPVHSNEKPDDVLRQMFEVFDNETENGKLYLSYPMVEALYDYKYRMCESYSGCYVRLDELSDYKEKSGNGNPNSSRHFAIESWREVLEIFILRIKCLFNLQDISYETYRDKITPNTIFEQELRLTNSDGVVFVLSGFPEFLFDYNKVDFWMSFVKLKRSNYARCTRDYRP